MKPPRPAMISAATGDARNAIKALASGVFVKATAWSPAVTTAGREPLIDGQAKNLAPSPTATRSSLLISDATKSPSNNMADFGRSPNTSAIDWVNVTCTAPVGPPWTNLGDRQYSASSWRVSTTL